MNKPIVLFSSVTYDLTPVVLKTVGKNFFKVLQTQVVLKIFLVLNPIKLRKFWLTSFFEKRNIFTSMVAISLLKLKSKNFQCFKKLQKWFAISHQWWHFSDSIPIIYWIFTFFFTFSQFSFLRRLLCEDYFCFSCWRTNPRFRSYEHFLFWKI